ncbi:MAG: hypothetical protein ACRDPL_11370 [Propionibacteriaceae bacterium]
MSEAPHRPPSGSSGNRPAAGYFTAALLIAAMVAGLAAIALRGGGGSDGTASAAGFAPDYSNFVPRREAAGVSTMGDPQDGSAHLHPHLVLYANGNRIEIPVNIGIDPSESPEEMASLHTHSGDGTIHVEGMSQATLGQFFQIWGVPFSSNQLGPYRVAGDKTVRMWVDGKPSTAFGSLQLADGQQIVVAFGPKESPPPRDVSS